MLRFLRKRVGIGVFALLFLSFFIGTVDVYAEKDDNAKCVEFLKGIEISHGDFSIDTEKGDAMPIKVTVPSTGVYEVRYNIVDYGEEAKDLGDGDIKDVFSGIESISGTSWTKDLPAGKEIFIIVSLESDYKEGDPATVICHAPTEIKIDNNGKIKTKNSAGKEKSTWKAESIQNPAESDVDNPIYGSTACELMRKGKYKNSFEKTSKKYDIIFNNGKESHDYDLNAWNDYAKTYFPYCYDASKKMAFALNHKNINYVRKRLLEIYTEKKNIKIGEIKNSEGYTSDNKVNNTQISKLSCQIGKFSSNKFWYEKSEDPIKLKSSGVWVCKITCAEEIEVDYGEPVAVSAGECLQYEVTVKSKVQCKTELNPDAKPKPPENFAAPVAACSGGSDQAGPNEEFDKCITKCDGGEYSQKCINKCYKKVYENKTKVSSENENNSEITNLNYAYDNNSNVKLLANNDENDNAGDESTDDKAYEIDKCKTNEQIYENLDYCVEELMEAKAQYPYGYYSFNKAKADEPLKYNMKWNSNGAPAYSVNLNGSNNCNANNHSGDCSSESYIDSIKRAAPYYLSTKKLAKSLIEGLHGYTSSNGRYRRYVIDNQGIKRQNSWRYQCEEKCGYIGKKGKIYNNADAATAYKKSLGEYAEAIAECNNNVKCETNEATFNINVSTTNPTISNEIPKIVTERKVKENGNDKIITKDATCGKDKGCSWTANNTKGDEQSDGAKGDTVIFTTPSGSTIADEPWGNGINGKCYAKRTMPWQHYKTTISFPGTFVELKTGEVFYKTNIAETDNKYKNGAHRDDNRFCTPLFMKDVNERWARMVTGLEPMDSSYIPDQYNINASIENFGKYNWKFDLQCFYGSYNRIKDIPCPNCDDGGNPECKTCVEPNCPDKCKTDTRLNYEIRVIDNENPFPNNRTPGYNWSSAATLNSSDPNIKAALTATGYGVNPIDYANKIKEIGNKVYNENAELTVTLNSDTIRSLANLPLESTGKYTKVNNIPGLYYYKMGSDITGIIGTNAKWKNGYNSDAAISATR